MDRGVAETGRHAAGLPGASREDVVIRRTSAGWRVEGSFPSLPTDTVDELGHALALADLLGGGHDPRARGRRGRRTAWTRWPGCGPRSGSSSTRWRPGSIVEQAIGVLTERWRVAPRDAFEQLRRVTRSRGLRIHDLARQVIDSCTDPDMRAAGRAGAGAAAGRDTAGAAAEPGPPVDGRRGRRSGGIAARAGRERSRRSRRGAAGTAGGRAPAGRGSEPPWTGARDSRDRVRTGSSVPRPARVPRCRRSGRRSSACRRRRCRPAQR